MIIRLKTLTVVYMWIVHCGIIMFSKRVLSNIWENIFIIYLERKDVEFNVGFKWLRISLKGVSVKNLTNLPY
jgi:hypothetical protein